MPQRLHLLRVVLFVAVGNKVYDDAQGPGKGNLALLDLRLPEGEGGGFFGRGSSTIRGALLEKITS